MKQWFSNIEYWAVEEVLREGKYKDALYSYPRILSGENF